MAGGPSDLITAAVSPASPILVQITIRKRAATEDEEEQGARKMQQLMAEPELDTIPEDVPEQPSQVSLSTAPAFSSDDNDGERTARARPVRAASPSPSFSDLSD